MSRKSKGAVLVEFAIGVPILVLMLYFCLDVPRAYQLVDKLKSASELTANLLLNVRAGQVDRLLTKDDLRYVGRALELYFNGNVRGDDFHISAYITCITGIDSGFTVDWRAGIDNDVRSGTVEVYTSENSAVIGEKGFESAYSSTITNDLKNTELAKFDIRPGETKLIIEAFIWDETDHAKRIRTGINRRFYMLYISLARKVIGNKFTVLTPYAGMINKDAPPQ